MDLQEGLARFVRQLEADGRSGHTIAQYRRHVRELARWAAQAAASDDVAGFDHEHVAAFLASPAARTRPDGRPRRPGTVNAMRASLKGFFRYLHMAGYIAEDPTRLVRRARAGTPPPRGLTEEEQRALLRVLADADGPEAARDHALFHLLLGAGLRLSEAIGLDVEDVDFDRSEVILRHAKGGGVEAAILAPDLARHLERFLGDRSSGPLFTSQSGRRLSPRHVQRRLKQWLQRAGVRRPASPHSLRHSFALRIYERTRDVLVVQRALRHKSVGSALIYAHAGNSDVRAALTA